MTATKTRRYGHIIGGHTVESSSEPIQRRSPASNELVAEFAAGTADDVRAAAAAARSAFDDTRWSTLPGADRARQLLKIAGAYRAQRDRLAEIEAEEVGKPIRMARGDIDGAISHFEYAASLAHDLHGDSYTDFGPEYFAAVIREPRGVAGLIIPWNFPALIFGQKVPYALAAGCTTVVKPSEFTSGTALEMTCIAQDAGLPDGVINVVSGYGVPVGQALVEDPDIDCISFTGSTATGTRIAVTAAATQKRVALELGGKGANIVFADADLDDAIDGSLFAVFFNTGECCVAGSRLLIEDSIADEFIARLVDRTANLRVGSPLDEEAELSALIHHEHAAKVMRYIDAGHADGAKLLTGGHRLDGEFADGAYIAPTIFDQVTPRMKIFREEIFGPVLSITRFSTVDEAIRLANDTQYGLGNTVWTKNVDTAFTVTRQLRSGLVWVNTTLDNGPQMPFGGVKASGYGREMGRVGLEDYTELKSCVIRLGKRTPYFHRP